MTETPRTDRYYGAWATLTIDGDTIFDFARQLERELGAARDQLAAVTRERDGLQRENERIKTEWDRDNYLRDGDRAEVERLNAQLYDHDKAAADEVMRLRALLREAHEKLNDVVYGTGWDAIATGETMQRIRAAIGEGE